VNVALRPGLRTEFQEGEVAPEEDEEAGVDAGARPLLVDTLVLVPAAAGLLSVVVVEATSSK